MKRITTSLIFLISAWILFTAHEFWLAPSQFRLKPGKTVQLDLLVGEDFHGELWGARKKRTESVHHYFGMQKEDLTAQALATDSLSMQFKCKKSGTHLLTMRSNNSFIELSGEDFNNYLKEDGIENILALREKQNQLGRPSREFYQRCAKALLQVGKKTDDTYSINCGMPLEIIPLQNPYKLKVGDKLQVKILFEGKPLPDAVVRSWHKVDETKTNQGRFRTNLQGVAAIELNANGIWMISLVKMLETNDKSHADYQSYWGSLTFEM
ncbi:MAG: DUF4198 domain-containing protein [Saprospiraceae bacterium]|nr:DUF4198 domain-containing protein [Saprospiraceae bacterium]